MESYVFGTLELFESPLQSGTDWIGQSLDEDLSMPKKPYLTRAYMALAALSGVS
jgi:hypothetical protein